EPDRALHPLRGGPEEVRPGGTAVVPCVAEDQEERQAAEEVTLFPQVAEHAAEVGARVEGEPALGRDVPVLDRDRDEPGDVGEEVNAAEVVRGGREESQAELARGRDRPGQVAERDQIRPARAARAPAGADGHAAARDRAADRAPEVEPPAMGRALAAREPGAETAAELADEIARLLHVARAEL